MTVERRTGKNAGRSQPMVIEVGGGGGAAVAVAGLLLTHTPPLQT